MNQPHIYMYPLFFGFPSHLGHHRALSRVPCALQSVLRVICFIYRRAWQPTPVFLPGESHGQRSLESYSPRNREESDRTDDLHTQSVCMPIPISQPIPPPKMGIILMLSCLTPCARSYDMVSYPRENRPHRQWG